VSDRIEPPCDELAEWIARAITFTPEELELLHDAISAWLADWIVRVTPTLGSHALRDARAVERYEAMVAVANKLGMNL